MPDVQVLHGNCIEVMAGFEPNSLDSIVTDPPYDLPGGFMNRDWDKTGIAFSVVTWQAVYRVLKPGGHLVCFGGTRTFHRLACAIEDAGFEIRDSIGCCYAWMYGSGFPKSMDVSKQLDKSSGIEREDKFEGSFNRRAGPTGNKRCETCGKWLVSGSPCQCPRPQDAPQSDDAKTWSGFGTALKPAWEPVILARKQLSESTVAANVLKHGTGALNIDGCRIGSAAITTHSRGNNGAFPKRPGEKTAQESGRITDQRDGLDITTTRDGRWPANVVLIHNDGCVKSGERQVKGRVINRFDDGAKPFGGGAGHEYTSEDLGDETVDVWTCEPSCAVRLLDEQSGDVPGGRPVSGQEPSSVTQDIYGTFNARVAFNGYGDTGGASRFFYTAKSSTFERQERTKQAGIVNNHPTVKPVDLMRWLVRLVTRPGGKVLDPFAGSGTTGVAAIQEGMDCVLIEKESEYIPIIHARLDGVQIGGLF